MPHLLKPTFSAIYLERLRQTPSLTAFQFLPTDPDWGPQGVWRRVSFAEFDEYARTVSAGLLSLGVTPGDRVALISQNRFEWILSDLAIIGSGAIPVPIHPSTSAAEIQAILTRTGACAVIVDDRSQLQKVLTGEGPPSCVSHLIAFESTALAIAPTRSNLISFRALRELGKRNMGRNPHHFHDQLRTAQASDLIGLLSTSGTTDVPKSAQVTQGNLASVLEDLVRTLAEHLDAERECSLLSLPLAHALGRVQALATWTFGWTLTLGVTRDKLLQRLGELRPSFLIGPHGLFEALWEEILRQILEATPVKKKSIELALAASRRVLRARQDGLTPRLKDLAIREAALRVLLPDLRATFGGRLKLLIGGGAPVSPILAENLVAAGIPLLEGYGLTETCAPLTLNLPESFRFGSAGKPLPEVQLKISEEGEILVRSQKVFSGYWGDPVATADAFQDGWLRTGDLGYLDDQGFLHVTGRKRHLLHPPGAPAVAPQGIESLLQEHPGIARAVVLGDGKPFLSALITLDPQSTCRYAESQQILYSDFPGLVQHPKIEAWVQRAVSQVNSRLRPHEAIQKFLVLPDHFSIESGELSTGHQIRRKFVNQKYKAWVERLYGP